MKINQQQAKEFLDNISSEDKVAIIHHNDLDGFASGILFTEWCENKGAKTKNFIANYGEWNPENSLEGFNKIILTDIAPGGLLEINLPLKKEIFYTDHHPGKEQIPEKILELRTTNKGYLPSSRTAGELTNIKPWLALAGVISDSGDLYPENKQYLEQTLKELNLSLEEFKTRISNTPVSYTHLTLPTN